MKIFVSIILTIIFSVIVTVHTEEDVKSSRVIVIGGGVAGLKAVSELLNENFKKVVLLEAETRLCGRINTVYDSNGEQSIELGAQWVSGSGLFDSTLVYSKSTKFGNVFGLNLGLLNASDELISLFNDAINGENLYRKTHFKDSPLSVDVLVTQYLNKYVANHTENGSNFNNFVASHLNAIRQLFQRHLIFLTSTHDWSKLTGEGLAKFSSNDFVLNNVHPSRGMDTICEQLLPRNKTTNEIDNVEIHHSPVTNINYGNDEVTVTTLDGSSHVGDLVISTIPLGVLKSKHEHLFSPQLPNKKVNAIKGINVAHVEKIVLEFDRPWWSTDDYNFIILWSDEELESLKDDRVWLKSLHGFFVADHKSNVLVALFQGTSTQLIHDVNDATIESELMSILKKISIGKYTVPNQPSKIVRTNWAENPKYLGAYSYNGRKSSKSLAVNNDFIEPLQNGNGKNVVFFAGEATSDARGTVHGAVWSGRRVVQQDILGNS